MSTGKISAALSMKALKNGLGSTLVRTKVVCSAGSARYPRRLCESSTKWPHVLLFSRFGILSGMYKANQEALFQCTNLGLVGLRQAEINYYFNVNSAIGTQAALIGGFTYGIFTQNPINTTPWASTVVVAYYCVTACAIASAVHVVINTMLIQVLSPGLALNGPIGSMARATDGMQIEQSHIIVAFGIMMSSFALSTVLAFWAVFDIRSAVISTILFFFSAQVWYYL